MKSKTVVAYCTSGLGNRIITIIGAFYWSVRLGYDFKIVWPTNNECMCDYEDVFDSYRTKKDESISELINESVLYNSNQNCIVAGFTYQKDRVDKKINDFKNIVTCQIFDAFSQLHDPDSLDNIDLSKYDLIIYNSIKIPHYISFKDVTTVIENFKINKSVLEKVITFNKQNTINYGTTNGILIRKTDGDLIFKRRPESYYKKLIEDDKHKQFFITSDDEATEKDFKQYSNVICYPKLEYVKYDKMGIYRGKQSVIEAFISMLILSRTNILDKDVSKSSFLKMAVYYSCIKF